MGRRIIFPILCLLAFVEFSSGQEKNETKAKAFAAPTGTNALEVEGSDKAFFKVGPTRDGVTRAIADEVSPGVVFQFSPDAPNDFPAYDDNFVSPNKENEIFIPPIYKTDAEKEKDKEKEGQKKAKTTTPPPVVTTRRTNRPPPQAPRTLGTQPPPQFIPTRAPPPAPVPQQPSRPQVSSFQPVQTQTPPVQQTFTPPFRQPVQQTHQQQFVPQLPAQPFRPQQPRIPQQPAQGTQSPRPLRPFRTNNRRPFRPSAPRPSDPTGIRTGTCPFTIFYKSDPATQFDAFQAYTHFAVVVSVDQCARTCHEFNCFMAFFDPINRHCQFNVGNRGSQSCPTYPNPLLRNNVPLSAVPLRISCITCQRSRESSFHSPKETIITSTSASAEVHEYSSTEKVDSPETSESTGSELIKLQMHQLLPSEVSKELDGQTPHPSSYEIVNSTEDEPSDLTTPGSTKRVSKKILHKTTGITTTFQRIAAAEKVLESSEFA
ncbi:hypothetical protein FO519_001010 [Halicephalobus sp. NKZ332]|nr:hypothetical protein FO519_001010 [Halicephalobus sp. NKZ332]